MRITRLDATSDCRRDARSSLRDVASPEEETVEDERSGVEVPYGLELERYATEYVGDVFRIVRRPVECGQQDISESFQLFARIYLPAHPNRRKERQPLPRCPCGVQTRYIQ